MPTLSLPTKADLPAEPAGEEIVYQLALEICHISDLNTRHPKPADVQELALSMKMHGQTTPAIVRHHPKKKGEFEIGAGARRRVACEVAHIATLGCVVRVLDDTAFEELILVENLQRQDPDPRAEIELLERLIKRGLHTTEQISAHLGKPAHWVERRRQLMKVIPALRKEWTTRDQYNEGNDITHFTIDMMELLGALPRETQEQLAETFGNYDSGDFIRCGSRVELQAYLDKEVLCRLDKAPFDLNDPRFFVKGCGPGCAMDSSAVAALFDPFDTKGNSACGRCLNPACFRKRAGLYQESKLAELEKEHGKDLPVVSPHHMGYGHTVRIGKRELKPSTVQKVLATPAKGTRKVLVVDDGALRIGYVPKQAPQSRNGHGGNGNSRKLVAPSVRLKERKQILQGKRLTLVHDELVKMLRASKRADCTEDVIDLAVIFGLPWRENTYDTEVWEQLDARKKNGFSVQPSSSMAYCPTHGMAKFKDREEALWHGVKYVFEEVIRLVGNVGNVGRVEADMRRVAMLIKFPFDAKKKEADLKILPPRSWGAVDVHTLEPSKRAVALQKEQAVVDKGVAKIKRRQGGLTAAMRKKLSAAMKARWSARRKAATKKA